MKLVPCRGARFGNNGLGFLSSLRSDRNDRCGGARNVTAVAGLEYTADLGWVELRSIPSAL